MIGDLHTGALVGKDGSIDWLCLPKFDSPACFAALLGTPDNGLWRISPRGVQRCSSRQYVEDTLVLQTEWTCESGSVQVTDFMPPRGEAADLVRIVEGVSGRVPMEMTLRLRFDYGHVAPWVHGTDGALAAMAGPDATWLRSPVVLVERDGATVADFTVGAGDRVPFVLTHQESHLPQPEFADPDLALRDTEGFWRNWLDRAAIDELLDRKHVQMVRRSLILLKALTYAPTGGIVAAATTSLPEQIGGPRNWDYRFCWLRDATFVLQALLAGGFVGEAQAWRSWLLRAVAGDPGSLQIMYGIDGRRRLPEATLDWLPGFAGSVPVRTGNAASEQLQLDVWGEVLDGLHVARKAGIAPDESSWDLQLQLADFLVSHWDVPDNGLWEIRGDRRHFVHSKVMAWVGMDRMIRAVEDFGREGPVDQWREVRQQIHDQVCERGFDGERNTFTQFYGSRGLDAALLLIPATGFLPWDDPRVIGTVEAVQRELCRDDYLLRYDTQSDGGVDGLPGDEGVFIVCTFWLVDALNGIGRAEEARELFERLLALCNDVGMLSEEYDIHSGHHLGNTPQAYSHVGLINSAMQLAGVQSSDRSQPGA